jgi:hypothetical protein
MEVWLDCVRRMPPMERVRAALAMSHLVLRVSEAGVRLAHPDADDREVFLRTAARHLSRELMIRAYGWDPQLHEDSGRRL